MTSDRCRITRSIAAGAGLAVLGIMPAAFLLLPNTAAHGQIGPGSTPPVGAPVLAPADPAQTKKDREQELEATRARRQAAIERENQIKAEIAALGEDRAKLAKAIVDGAAAQRATETRIPETETRIRALDGREQRIHEALNARRGEIGEVLAALQRAGRRTPPALLVKPEDALQSLRTAMLLGAVVPDMRQRVEALIADLNELIAIRTALKSERETLAAQVTQLADNGKRLALLVEQRQARQKEAERELAAEQARAVELAKEADGLQDLIAKLEISIQSAARAAAAARLKGTPDGSGKPNLAALSQPGRLSPAIAFAAARGMLPLPVNGLRLRTFGAPDGAGSTEKGLSLAARSGAQVTSPCDGWVVYAGPFRSYGQLLILNAGGGYHVLLAGMDRISVNIGQFVVTGEAVATMGTASQVAAMLDTAPGQPVLYVEFRKDGVPIDPTPWWASTDKALTDTNDTGRSDKSDKEKVRG